MARINGDISDLFFNTDLDTARTYDDKKQFAGFDEKKLYDEAMAFLGCLTRLGVDTPTADDLIADLYRRL